MENKIFQPIDNQIKQLTKIKKAVKTIISKKTAQKIREFLKEKKIKGYIGDGDNCPLSVYFEKTTYYENVAVYKDKITFNNDGEDKISIDAPACISNFVKNFDNKKYPELAINLDAY